MKILFLCNKVPFPPKDGGAIASFNMIHGLAKAGASCTCLAMSTPKHKVRISEVPKKVAEEFNLKIVHIDTTIRLIPLLRNLLFSELPYNVERFIDDNYASELVKLLKEEEFDLIQLEGLYLTPYIPLLKSLSKASLSFRAHNVEFEIWDRTALQMLNPLKKWYVKTLAKRLKSLEKKYLSAYDYLVTISSRDQKAFRDMGYSNSSITVPSGFDFAAVSTKEVEKKEVQTLFHIGGLDWLPNQEGLIWFVNEVWPEVIKKHPKLIFRIAGRNGSDSFLKKLKKENVQFCGEVENAASFMNAEGVMVVPLFSGSGMRIKLIEGMALGKNVISTSIGAEGIPLKHMENGMLANTKEEFLLAIDFLLEQKEDAFKQACNAKELIYRKFDNLALTKELLNFYKKDRV